MAALKRVHRFRDHAVAGVNWRPTRFVDDVPSARVCCLCGVIPRRTLLLPCSHTLCQPCHTASSQDSGGRCPLDQEPFEKEECVGYDLPPRKTSIMKVHCWNEAHGCEFVGAIEDVLKHNETECDYHAVECLRCGEEVLHRELSTHNGAGCSAGTENPSPESNALTLQDVIASLEEMKRMLRDPDYDDLLPEIQSKMNELTERLAIQGSTAMSTRGVGASALVSKALASKFGATTSSTSLQEPASRRNPTEQASTSSSSLSRSERLTVHRKLDFFTYLTAEVLENMRKASSRDYPQYAITGCGPMNIKCHLSSAGLPLTSECTWREVRGDIEYELAVENIHEDMFSRGKSINFAKITVLHTGDAYSEVEVFKHSCFLFVPIDFYGMLEGSPLPAPSLSVSAYDGNGKCMDTLYSFQEPCCCKHDDSFLHFHRTFRMSLDTVRSYRYSLNGTLLFKICFSFPDVEETQSEDMAA